MGRILKRPPVMRLLSLYHVMIGSGLPVTTHVISAEVLSATVSCGCGCSMIDGFSAEVKHLQKLKINIDPDKEIL